MSDTRDLLDREIDLLWGTDDCGRTEPAPLLAVPVPDQGTDHPGTDDQPPETFPRERFSASGHSVRRCRSFVIDTVPEAVWPAGVRSTDSTGDGSELVRPEPQWQPDEWETLLSGVWGPWAAAVDDDGRVLALCHTPRLARGAAEAGVWTHADHRGRGLAVAVTARWARLIGASCDAVFYSARPDNAASLAVARRLGARPLGTIWQLWPAE